MKYIINDQVVLSQPLEGPLATYIGLFAEWSRDQGYALSTQKRQVLLAACFSRWLGRHVVPLRSVSPEHSARFLHDRAGRVRLCRGDPAALRHLLEFLRRQGAMPAEKIRRRQSTPIDRCARVFEQYLHEERALARTTIVRYVGFVHCFLEKCFGNGPVILARVDAGDVVQFVQRQAARLSLKTAKLLTAALRSFLQYARYRGDIALDLAAAVPTVANWSMSSIPRAIPVEQVRQLLARIDRHTAIGRRDYAILLLLARLGLRASEVVFLELDDIDWKTGCLSVRGKGGRRIELPLSPDVGEAMVAYLQHGRPNSPSRRVFLQAKAPRRGFLGPSAVSSLVRRVLQLAGIDAPTQGAHQFRHALATQMLRHGASLSEIGELLGHRSPETTKIYAQVDLDALRTLALPWPGGVR